MLPRSHNLLHEFENMLFFFLQVLLLTLQRSTVGQVELNLGDKDLKSTLESSDNSTNYGEREKNIGFLTGNTKCTPGKRPDPGSCSRYFLCVEFLPRVFREYAVHCPPSLIYNSHISECVSPYFYQCAIRSLQDPITWTSLSEVCTTLLMEPVKFWSLLIWQEASQLRQLPLQINKLFFTFRYMFQLTFRKYFLIHNIS